MLLDYAQQLYTQREPKEDRFALLPKNEKWKDRNNKSLVPKKKPEEDVDDDDNYVQEGGDMLATKNVKKRSSGTRGEKEKQKTGGDGFVLATKKALEADKKQEKEVGWTR